MRLFCPGGSGFHTRLQIDTFGSCGNPLTITDTYFGTVAAYTCSPFSLSFLVPAGGDVFLAVGATVTITL